MSQLTLYTTGTITFTNGSADLVGVGTSFIGLQQGDLVLGPDGKWYELAAAPTDNLAATLDRIYAGATVANSPGGDWVILRSSIQRDSVRTATKQLTDISSLWRQLISLTQSDQVIRPSKALTTDRAGMILQKALTDLFQVGTFEDDDFSIRYLLASTWTKALGVDPTTGATSFYSQILLGGVISPTMLTSTTNNYAPAGLAQANVLRLSTNATRTLTGITSGAPGRVLALMNVGSFSLALENEGGSSAAANRFALSSNLTIPAGGAVLLIYDGVANRWRVLGGAGSGSGGAMGAKGWSPILAYVSNGEGGKVAQIVDWTGGEGIKPAVGAYIGATGQVATVAEAVNVVGPKGDQVQFRMNGAVLQWTYAGSLDWQDLYTLDLIIGPPSALQWTFSTTTADADPGAGKLRFNNATFGSITQIFVDATEHFGVDITSFLDTWDDSTAAIKGTLTLIDPATPQVAVFNVTGITAASGYRKLAVTPVVGDIFVDARLLSVQFSRTGNNGAAATIEIGTVSTLAAGASATVANTGTTNAAVLDFGIPQGIQGVQGVKGDTGDTGPSYKGTSTTSLAVSAGAKSATTQAGLAYLPGARARLSSTATPTTFIEGVVTAYDPATGALNFMADKIGGSGTLASWNVNLAGEPGVGDMSAANRLSELSAPTAASEARANLGVPHIYGQCRLTLSGGNLVLKPLNGNLLTVDGVPCVIPDTGVSLAPTSLTPGSLYYIYATASGGVINAMEASPTGHATSTTAGNKGNEIQSGDNARTLVGMAMPVAGPAWSDSGAALLVASWHNRTGKSGVANLSATRSITNVAWLEFHSELRVQFLTWADELVDATTIASGYPGTASQVVFFAIGFDGTTPEPGLAAISDGTVGAVRPLSCNASRRLSEGYHYATILGGNNAAATVNLFFAGGSNGSRSGLQVKIRG